MGKEATMPDPLPGEPSCKGVKPKDIRCNLSTGDYEILYNCPKPSCILRQTGDLPFMESDRLEPSYGSAAPPFTPDEVTPLLRQHAANQTATWRRGCVATKIMHN